MVNTPKFSKFNLGQKIKRYSKYSMDSEEINHIYVYQEYYLYTQYLQGIWFDMRLLQTKWCVIPQIVP